MKAYTFFFALLCLFVSCEKDEPIEPLSKSIENATSKTGQISIPENQNLLNLDASQFNRPCGVYWACSSSWSIQSGHLVFAQLVGQDFVIAQIASPLRLGIYKISFDVNVLSGASEFDVLLGGQNVKVVSLPNGGHSVVLFHKLTANDSNDFTFFGVAGLFTIDNVDVRSVYLEESLAATALK